MSGRLERCALGARLESTSGTMQERSRAEFEAICVPFMRMLYGAAVRLTRRPEDARDVVQETYLRAYRTFEGFARGSNARAWLFTILHSVLANRYRKQRRTPESVSLDDVAERFLVARDAETGWSGRSSSAEDVESALRMLPQSFREVILLVDVEGLSYEEAAAALACPVGTVRSRLARGRRALFVHLSGRAASAAAAIRPGELDGAD